MSMYVSGDVREADGVICSNNLSGLNVVALDRSRTTLLAGRQNLAVLHIVV